MTQAPSYPRSATAATPASRRLWLLAAGFVALHAYRSIVGVWDYIIHKAGDFGGYYVPGLAILRGQSPFVRSFVHTPLLALLLAPLALLDLTAARIVWSLISQLAFLAAGWAIWRVLGSDQDALLATGGTFLLAGTVRENLGLGQVNLFLLAVLCAAFLFDSRRLNPRPALAAALLGLAAGLKLWPGTLLVAFARPGRWRGLAVGVSTGLLAVALPLLALRALVSPPHLPVRSEYWMGNPARLNFSLPAMVLRFTYDLSAQTPSDALPSDWELGNNPELSSLSAGRRALSAGVAVSTLLIGIGLLAWRTHRSTDDPHTRLAVLCALTSLAMLASPISWYHYQLFQLPGIALLARDALRRRALARVGGLAALLCGLTRSQVLVSWAPFAGLSRAQSLAAAGTVVPLLGCVLFALLLAAAARSPREPLASDPRPANRQVA